MNKQQKTIEAVINDPTLLAIIKIKNPKFPFQKIEKKLEVRTPTLRTVSKITSILSGLDFEGNFYESICKNADTPALFLATAIHNDNSPVPKWLTRALMDDFSLTQIQTMVNVTYGRIGIEDFFPILVSMTKASLMPISIQEANPSKV